VNTTSKIIRVELDPDKKLPDIDSSNDVWTPEIEAKQKAEEEAKKKAEEAKRQAEEEEKKAEEEKKKKRNEFKIYPSQ
jgi:membrane protein involved in colicin uptake